MREEGLMGGEGGAGGAPRKLPRRRGGGWQAGAGVGAGRGWGRGRQEGPVRWGKQPPLAFFILGSHLLGYQLMGGSEVRVEP